MNVHCTLLNIVTKNTGRLLALADVELDFDGVMDDQRVEEWPNPATPEPRLKELLTPCADELLVADPVSDG